MNNTDTEIKDEGYILTRFADSDADGERLDRYISDEVPELSRSYIQNMISKGLCSIIRNGSEKAAKSSTKVAAGDEIRIRVPEPEAVDIVPEDIPLDIIYEDHDILIVNKPQGMVVHPAPGHYTGTLVNGIMYHTNDLSSINGIMRPGIVHRIDKDTSGLLVICKNDRSHRSLAEQFSRHSITRIYTAICYGGFSDYPEANLHNIFTDDYEADGFIIKVDRPIGRAKNDRKKMAVDISGRRAVTHIRPVRKLKNGEYSLIECRLETGRTHQIRVHSAYIKHPILGDPVYGPKKCPYNLSGQMLHAGVLGFVHPTSGEYVEFRSDLPKHFSHMLDVLS